MSIRKTRLALAIAAVFALPASAFATNGILPAGNGMVSQGMGGAGLANAGEAAAGMDNPALISQTGNAISAGWTIFSPERKVDTTGVPGYPGAVVKSDSTMFAIPQAAFTSRINSDMNWGIMAYAMGGMNTDYPTGLFPGAGQTTPQSVNLQGMILAPTMSYDFTPNFSGGISVLFGYETLTTRNLFGQGAPGTGQRTATGVGVKLGLDAKVTDGVEIGAMFQPKLSMTDNKDYFKRLLSGFGFTGNSGLDLPTEYGVGAKFAVGPSVDILADALYYDWKGVDLFKFFGWKSEPVYKIGAEYRPTNSLALRIGYNYGKSPIQGGASAANGSMDAAFANYPFPAITESHISLGVGYKLDSKATLNAYYMYSPSVTQTATMTSQTSGGPVPAGTKITMYQNAFGLGVNYAF